MDDHLLGFPNTRQVCGFLVTMNSGALSCTFIPSSDNCLYSEINSFNGVLPSPITDKNFFNVINDLNLKKFSFDFGLLSKIYHEDFLKENFENNNSIEELHILNCHNHYPVLNWRNK